MMFAEGVPPLKKGNCAFCGSLIDSGPDNGTSILRTCDGVGIVLGWPKELVFAINYNNPPKIPDIPAGIILGVPVATYNFSAYTVDSDGDQVKYTLDWGDGTILHHRFCRFRNSCKRESYLGQCRNIPC